MANIKIDEKMSFESALLELELLLREMESGQKPLEELIQNFERGVALGKFCRAKLATMEKRIKVLTADDGAGGDWADFSAAAAPENSPR